MSLVGNILKDNLVFELNKAKPWFYNGIHSEKFVKSTFFLSWSLTLYKLKIKKNLKKIINMYACIGAAIYILITN